MHHLKHKNQIKFERKVLSIFGGWPAVCPYVVVSLFSTFPIGGGTERLSSIPFVWFLHSYVVIATSS